NFHFLPCCEMTRQERTLAALLEQAFRVKEDIVGSLHATQGSVLMEASARKLLENHIQTITHIVKQLSKDIQVLEAQVVQRDSVASGMSFAVQSLDHKNLAGIGDLRGRVARYHSQSDHKPDLVSQPTRSGGNHFNNELTAHGWPW
uniref:Family with sequence similarity 81 member B n=1 Tax=Electrophorus electricus TaxID=8005 RepID=A0A4W4G1A7_ELEEL